MRLAVLSLAIFFAIGAVQHTTSEPRRVRIAPEVAAQYTRKEIPPQSIGVTGDAVLKIVVSRKGDVISVSPVTGGPRLVQAATKAVRAWKYAPYLLNGDPVEFETEVTIHFRGEPR